MLRFSARIGRHASLLDGRRHALVVEAALVHAVGLADENMRGHFVFRAAKLTERRQKDQIIKSFGGLCEAQSPRFRAVFWTSNGVHLPDILMPLCWTYNHCI